MHSPDTPFLSPDFADLLRELSATGARFLVVGGFAVSIHGEPRSTGDLDVANLERTKTRTPRKRSQRREH